MLVITGDIRIKHPPKWGVAIYRREVLIYGYGVYGMPQSHPEDTRQPDVYTAVHFCIEIVLNWYPILECTFFQEVLLLTQIARSPRHDGKNLRREGKEAIMCCFPPVVHLCISFSLSKVDYCCISMVKQDKEHHSKSTLLHDKQLFKLVWAATRLF